MLQDCYTMHVCYPFFLVFCFQQTGNFVVHTVFCGTTLCSVVYTMFTHYVLWCTLCSNHLIIQLAGKEITRF
jgi:hypothetical protein